MKNSKVIKWLQILFLLGGTIFAWQTIIREFINFYATEGTIFKVTDCVYTNPVTTPCFYGGLGFLVALFWTWYILNISIKAQQIKQRFFHTLFLLGGTLFAWSVVAWEWWQLKQAAGQPVVGCSGLMTSIFDSSCLYGASFFLAALIVGGIIYWQEKKII